MVSLLALPAPLIFWKANDTFVLDVSAFARHLRRIKPFRARCKDVAELNREMHCMFFCALYFALAGRWNERGGPQLPERNYFPGARTVVDALSSSRIYPVVTYDDGTAD